VSEFPPNHPYLSLRENARKTMLEELGIGSVSDLETDIPDQLREEFSAERRPWSESGVLDWHRENASKNRSLDQYACFLGGGLYDHFVPSTVMSLMGREEFLTSYTPYQAEMNQGTLQAMFEFQSMISELMALPVTNASMYDGATAFAEAVLMAVSETGRDRVFYSPNLFESWIQVLKTYADPLAWQLIELPTESGSAYFPDDWGEEPPAAVCLGYPNRWGCADHVTEWSEQKPDKDTVGIAGVNPLAMALLSPPGELGFDVAVAEGQPLGLPLSGGAPQLGLFSADERFLRNMPGRLAGETEDRRGNRCFVLTLQTREQHIRRERATSNICTNHALLTIGVCVFLATLGAQGLRARARENHKLGQLLVENFRKRGCGVVGEPIFNEVSIDDSLDPGPLEQDLEKVNIVGGYQSKNRYISSVTERRSESEIEQFTERVSQHANR